MRINKTKKILVIKIFILLVFLALVFLFLSVNRPDFLSLSTIIFAFGCSSIVFSAIFLLYCLTSKLEDIVISPLDVLYGAVVVTALLSFFFMSHQRQAFDQIYTLLATFFLYLLIRFSYKRYLRNKLSLFVLFLVAVAGIESFRGLIQFLSNSEMKGLFFNVNLFSMYIALHIPLALALLWGKKHRLFFKIILLSVTGLLILCVILSKCRTAYIGLLLTLPLMLFVHYGPRIKRLYFRDSKYSLVILSVISFFTLGLIARVLFFLKPLSAVGRILAWKISWQMFSEFPILGIGFNNFSLLFNLYQGRFFDQGMGTAMERMSASNIPYAFNDYIKSAVEFGVLGFIVFIVFWVLIIKNVWSVFMRFYRARMDEIELQLLDKNCHNAETGPKRGELQIGIAGSVLLYMIMSFFYPQSRILYIYLLFNILLAFLASENQIYRLKTSEGKKKRK